jgi:hypothetical protein
MRSILLPFILAVYTVGVADDGWWCSAGGIECYGKSHPTIRMVSEDLKIHLLEDQSADVDVTFVFHNEGKATQVTMAFPETYEMKVGASVGNFRTWVDGKRVAVKRKEISRGDPKAAEPMDETGKAVWLKKVSFAANQTLNVRVAYNGGMSGTTSGDRTFTYELTTGATWKGPIGLCKIAVTWPKQIIEHLPANTELCAPYLELAPARWQYLPGRCAVAILENWKPKDDLAIEMRTGFGNFWINGKHISAKESMSWYFTTIVGSPNDPMIRCATVDNFFGASAAKLDDFGPNGIIKLSSGKKVKLPRGSKVVRTHDDNEDPADNEFVYLKDLVEALGGRFHYNATYDRVEISL